MAKEKKEQAIADRFIGRFEDEMKKLASGLNKKGCTKKYKHDLFCRRMFLGCGRLF